MHPRLRFPHRGIVAMANSGDKNSNDSQFFITLGSFIAYLSCVQTVLLTRHHRPCRRVTRQAHCLRAGRRRHHLQLVCQILSWEPIPMRLLFVDVLKIGQLELDGERPV